MRTKNHEYRNMIQYIQQNHRLPQWGGIALGFVLCCGAITTARAATVFDQSGIDPSNSYDISGFVYAEDFQLTVPLTLRSFKVYLVDNQANNNGVLDSFSGTLSWALYNNDAGPPGSISPPGSIIASGSASGSLLVLTDTGMQDNFNDDIVLAHANFAIPQALAAGTYWLAVHEGTWQSPSDGSPIWWSKSNGSFGSGIYVDVNETAPGTAWSGGNVNERVAFALLDTAVVPEPTAASLFGVAGLALLARRRREEPLAACKL